MNIEESGLSSIDDQLLSSRAIALLRIRFLQENGPGFAESFCSWLEEAMRAWSESQCSHHQVNEVLQSSTLAVQSLQEVSLLTLQEESTDDATINIRSLNCHVEIQGRREGEWLCHLLRLHVRISQLDPTLGEELGKQGTHSLLARLLLDYDRLDEDVNDDDDNEEDNDDDIASEIRELACEIAARTGGAFPLKVSPFGREELQQRLPLVFAIRPVPLEESSNCVTSDAQTVLLHQVTSRQTAQEDVGFVMWPSSVVLARWLVTQNISFLQNKRVLELGAGCGLVGLVAAGILGSLPSHDDENEIASVMLTDVNPVVLENLRRNIHLNLAPRPRQMASVAALDFYQQRGDSISGWIDGRDGQVQQQVDIILAADIICQPDDAVAAANTIHDALKPGGCAFVVCADAHHRFGVDHFESECQRIGCTVFACNVADLYQGRLLDCDTMLHLTAGYVDGMKLTFFEVRKPKVN